MSTCSAQTHLSRAMVWKEWTFSSPQHLGMEIHQQWHKSWQVPTKALKPWFLKFYRIFLSFLVSWRHRVFQKWLKIQSVVNDYAFTEWLEDQVQKNEEANRLCFRRNSTKSVSSQPRSLPVRTNTSSILPVVVEEGAESMPPRIRRIGKHGSW